MSYGQLTLVQFSESESESYVTTDDQSATLSWNNAPIWGLQPDFYYCQTDEGLLMSGALSDDWTGLSFTNAAGPRPRIHSWVPWDSRLPFSSLPTTLRATIEIFDSTSTRDVQFSQLNSDLMSSWHGPRTENTPLVLLLGADHIENTFRHIVAWLRPNRKHFHRIVACLLNCCLAIR
jgi:hypothetical protein